MKLVAPGGRILRCNLLPAAYVAAASAAEMAAGAPALTAGCSIWSFWRAEGVGHADMAMSTGHAVAARLVRLLLYAIVGVCNVNQTNGFCKHTFLDHCSS